MSNFKKLIPAQLIIIFFLLVAVSWGVVPVPSNRNDFFLPGSQPGQSGQLETPDKCDNCHGGYNRAVEPAFNWRGSMMAQAARDPLFYASLAIANQDAPASGELCNRCHSPAAWLERRAEPANGQAFNKNDREGVQCDLCHKLVKPSGLGVNPYPGDAAYTGGTYPQDQADLAQLSPIPGQSANGMYVADPHNGKRGPFNDADAKHHRFYSPFHQEAALCGSCHDASNPIFMKVEGALARMRPDESEQTQTAGSRYVPNGFGQPAPNFDPYTMFPVSRTYSEWKTSAYNTFGGVYAPQFGGNKPFVSGCQDCHMRDVTGTASSQPGATLRNDLPLHDLAGGNSFVLLLVRGMYPADVDTAALTAGVARALGMLSKAVTLEMAVTPRAGRYLARVRVTNETGHKLPSGNPMGRRIWLNVKAYDSAGTVIFESGAYNSVTAELLRDAALKVYEVKYGISAEWASTIGLPAGPSFHLVLNNAVLQDSRIPPRGFVNAAFEAIGSPVVGYHYPDGQYWDETNYLVPGTAAKVVATLFYQTLSKEYVEFLRNENRTNGWGKTLYDQWAAQGKSAPVPMATSTVILPLTDTQAPAAPGNLVARTVFGSTVELNWSAAVDNVGVVRYDIFRDEAFLASTTNTHYANRGLAPFASYSYCVKAIDAAGNVSAASNIASASTYEKKGPVAILFAVTGPNPFNAVTQFAYYLPEASPVEVSVFNLLGQKVATLVEGRQEAGEHQVTWAGGNAPSGVYFLLLATPTERLVQKVVLLK